MSPCIRSLFFLNMYINLCLNEVCAYVVVCEYYVNMYRWFHFPHTAGYYRLAEFHLSTLKRRIFIRAFVSRIRSVSVLLIAINQRFLLPTHVRSFTGLMHPPFIFLIILLIWYPAFTRYLTILPFYANIFSWLQQSIYLKQTQIQASHTDDSFYTFRIRSSQYQKKNIFSSKNDRSNCTLT